MRGTWVPGRHIPLVPQLCTRGQGCSQRKAREWSSKTKGPEQKPLLPRSKGKTDSIYWSLLVPGGLYPINKPVITVHDHLGFSSSIETSP